MLCQLELLLDAGLIGQSQVLYEEQSRCGSSELEQSGKRGEERTGRKAGEKGWGRTAEARSDAILIAVRWVGAVRAELVSRYYGAMIDLLVILISSESQQL